MYFILFFVNLISENYQCEVFIEYTKMFTFMWGRNCRTVKWGTIVFALSVNIRLYSKRAF